MTARFSGGEYSTNTVAIHDQAGSTLTFNKCVDIVSNCYGIATSEIVGEITTLALDGMSLLNNSIGIHGGSGNITSGGINSFQMPEGSSCDFAATPRLISMDVNQMAAPSINLNGNHWLDSQGGTLTVPPVQSDWFCIVNGPNNWCTTSNIPTDNLQLEGCASGPCEDPKTCDYYCQLYPESLPCYSGGGGVFKGFTATPNPSGGIVALSHLPENGGTLHVFDSRGSLVKTYQLEASTHQVIDFYNLHSGIYNLQLIDREKNDPVFVRLVLSK